MGTPFKKYHFGLSLNFLGQTPPEQNCDNIPKETWNQLFPHLIPLCSEKATEGNKPYVLTFWAYPWFLINVWHALKISLICNKRLQKNLSSSPLTWTISEQSLKGAPPCGSELYDDSCWAKSGSFSNWSNLLSCFSTKGCMRCWEEHLLVSPKWIQCYSKLYIQGVPLTTVYFQRHTAPTKIIRFQKLLHCTVVELFRQIEMIKTLVFSYTY